MKSKIRNILNELKNDFNVKATPEMILKVIKLLKSKNTTEDDILPFLSKSIKTNIKKTDKITSSEVTKDDEYVIINPNSGNKNAHVLFGGYHTNPSYSKNGANMSAMLNYVKYLEPYKSNALIVITHHMNSLGNVEKYLKENFDARVSSIAGFSQGGREAWKHSNNSSLSIVGLLDPSTYDIGIGLGSNTRLICNPSNWGTSGFVGDTRKRLTWYCENKNQSEYQGKIECVKLGHMAIVPYFYAKYGGRL